MSQLLIALPDHVLPQRFAPAPARPAGALRIPLALAFEEDTQQAPHYVWQPAVHEGGESAQMPRLSVRAQAARRGSAQRSLHEVPAHDYREPYEELNAASWTWDAGRVSPELWCVPSDDEALPASPVSYWAKRAGMARWVFALLSQLSVVPDAGHNAAALFVLTRRLPDTTAPQREHALGLLAKAVCDWLRLWRAGGLDAAAMCNTVDGMGALDASFMRALRRVGPTGEEYANEWTAQLRKSWGGQGSAGWEPWSLWLRRDPAGHNVWRVPALTVIADVLWEERVRVQYERSLSHRPALAQGVVDGLLPLLTRSAQVAGEQVLGPRGEQIATLDARLASTVTLGALGGVHGHRLLSYLVRTVHTQSEAGAHDWRRVEVPGGLPGLRTVLGVHDSGHGPLRELLRAGSSLSWSTAEGEGCGLWSWHEQRPAPGRPATLEIIAGAPLTPGWAVTRYHGSGVDARRARRLVPVLEHEPPIAHLHSRHQAPALALAWLALVELRDHAAELAAHGVITTSMERWQQLAALAGLPLASLEGLLKVWSARDSDGVQLLELMGEQWTLAAPHALARDFVAEAGRREVEGRAAGRRSRSSKKR